MRTLRIFLSSPGDVITAREVAAQAIEKLALDYAHRLQSIVPYMWEHEAMIASGHFQDSIEPPSAFDIVVLILWSRLGTPLPERTSVREYRGIDGRSPITGTEWEYEEALRGARAHGAPDLLVFRSLQPATIDARDPRVRQEQLHQLEALDDFWSRHFANRGAFLGAYTDFADNVELAKALDHQLRQLIDKRLALGAKGEAATAWGQAPFRGLEAYEFEHAPIYFGQDQPVGRAMLQLSANASAGSAFLLILGASGSGKSSLVRAGIAPKLFVPRRIPGVAFLRRAVFRPSDLAKGEDLFAALARCLTAAPGEGENLVELGQPETLAAHLRGAPREPSLPFRLALDLVTADAQRQGRILSNESARLLIVVDQLEELFTDDQISPEGRRSFISLLAGLARSGVVWVVATMRRDFWPRADQTPELVNLAEGFGKLELLSPSAAQLSQMIGRPADVAGISFEVEISTGIPLNEVIAEEVARDPGALPLLSYLLDQMYRTDILADGGSALTYATYFSLGKLEGAIAARAEAVIGACAPEDLAALPSVLFALVQTSVGLGDHAIPVARSAPAAAFALGTSQRRLVEALLNPDARLLVSDADAEGTPTVRLAHESLISKWPRARDFVASHAEALRIRGRIEERYALWRGAARQSGPQAPPAHRHGRGSFWRLRSGHEPGLLQDIDLNDGRRLVADHRADLDPDVAAYIDKSATEDLRRRARSVRRLGSIALLFALLSALASFGLFAARSQAARTSEAESKTLATAADSFLAAGDHDAAEGIVLAALSSPQVRSTKNAALLATAFELAISEDAQLAILSGHTDSVNAAAYSPDGRTIVTGSDDGTARTWDSATGIDLAMFRENSPVRSVAYSSDGKQIATGAQDGTVDVWSVVNRSKMVERRSSAPVNSVAFSPDGARIVSAHNDGTLHVWPSAGGKPLIIDAGGSKAVESAEFSPDGRQIVTASTDHTARIWDATTGSERVKLMGHYDVVYDASFSPDARRVLTASEDGTARVWDAQTGQELFRLRGPPKAVGAAAFSPNGQLIVTASQDGSIRLWDASSGAPRGILLTEAKAASNSVAFSPDGRTVVTGFQDGTARVLDVAPAGALVLSGDGGSVYSAAFSPTGERLASASGDGAVRIWDWARSAVVTRLLGHKDLVYDASYSPDGRRVVTASRDDSAAIWDADAGSRLRTLSGHSGFVYSAAYSPDGRQVVTASADKTARIWDATSGAQLNVLRGHDASVLSAAYSPDGKHVVTASADHTARVWDAATGKQVAILSGHSGGVNTAAYSPDGREIVTGSEDGDMRIWNASTGAGVATLTGPMGNVISAVFSPSGQYILSASDDDTARIWDADRHELLSVLRGHLGALESAGYAPDGKHVATASFDGTVRVWPAGAPPLLQSQIAWAQAARPDPVAPPQLEGRGMWSWLGFNRLRQADSASDSNIRLANLATREERSALRQTTQKQRDDLLLSAFKKYAMVVASSARSVPLSTAHWTYRRATLARVLARDGMMQQVADIYRQIEN
jgi:WD40 repeat protein